ncbi:HD-GYP domain-containing protein [Cohnella xylanilytica]|uniref:HD-GYP domain-containing protein n=1 Tax=Cohnella xylanilytica TaxID=557555 RepID=UPI001BB451FB|nr:HD domain-containing phosphohydrolase [Cohnella xylanilytica]
MRLVPVDELEEGDLLGRGLYDEGGRLMLRQGVPLTSRLIEGIKKRGHQYLFVQLNEKRAAASGFDLISNLRLLTKDLLGRVFRSVRQNGSLPLEPLMDWADHVSYSIAEEKEITIRLSDLERDPGRDEDHSELIAHSLNVCFLSMLTAKALGYKEKQIHEVALGSLLHDIGLVLPHDGTFFFQHPLIGHDLLRKLPDFPSESLKMVVQHHEQVDGTGFPYALRGPQVSEAAQIVGLCSEFDYFMNGGLKFRLPGEGIDFVMSKTDTAFGYGVVRAFLKAFQPYPVGTKVRLTGGLLGTVVELNRGHSCRPVVQLQPSGTSFDLMKHTTFMIEEVIHAD